MVEGRLDRNGSTFGFSLICLRRFTKKPVLIPLIKPRLEPIYARVSEGAAKVK